MKSMNIRSYQVDAFASCPFEGKPAAVCPPETRLDDAILQASAGENNLSVTAFLVPTNKGFNLRWFTPVREVDLRSHATLAAARVIFEHLGCTKQVMDFATRSGVLRIEKTVINCGEFPGLPPGTRRCPGVAGQGPRRATRRGPGRRGLPGCLRHRGIHTRNQTGPCLPVSTRHVP